MVTPPMSSIIVRKFLRKTFGKTLSRISQTKLTSRRLRTHLRWAVKRTDEKAKGVGINPEVRRGMNIMELRFWIWTLSRQNCVQITSPATTLKCAQLTTKKLKINEDHQALTNLSSAVISLRKSSVLRVMVASIATHESKSSTTPINIGPSSALPVLVANVTTETIAPSLTLKPSWPSIWLTNSKQMSTSTTSTLRQFGVRILQPSMRRKIVSTLTTGKISAANHTFTNILVRSVPIGSRQKLSQPTRTAAQMA